MKNDESNKEQKTRSTAMRWLTFVVVAIAIISTLTLVVSDGQHTQLKAIGTAGTIVPNGVNNTLNITFSDVSYVTQPPNFVAARGSYTGISNVASTYHNDSGTFITNATYEIFSANKTATSTSLAYENFNFSAAKGSTVSYMFEEVKIAYNGTGTGYIVLSHNKAAAVPVASLGTNGVALSSANKILANTTYIQLNETASKATPTLVYYAKGTGTNGSDFANITYKVFNNSFTMKPMQFYDLTIYAYNKNLIASAIAPNNGTILSEASVGSLPTKLNYTYLNNTEIQYKTAATPSANSTNATIFDWMYLTDYNSNSIGTASVLPSIQTAGISPMTTSASSFVNQPFDPAAVNQTKYTQAPNATKISINTGVGGQDFAEQISASNNTTLNEVGLNATAVTNSTFNVSHGVFNSRQGFGVIATNGYKNNVVTANIHVAVWNSEGINSAVMNFLKNYTALKATTDTGTQYMWNDMTIVSYMVQTISISENLSTNDASAVRNYFDNSMASVLQANNLSLVDTNTTAIVAGAFAGDFYYQGMAIVPTVMSNGMIVNPETGQKFASLSDAGFAVGAYISAGAVVVPQLNIIGWSEGMPIFGAGFSFGSLLGGLSSAGSSIANYLGNGVTGFTGGIGTAIHSATNYVVKPITTVAGSTASDIASHVASFKDELAGLTNTIMPSIGAIPGDIRSSVGTAIGPFAGAVSHLSSTLAQTKNDLVTAVSSGYSGLTTKISNIGTAVSNGISSSENTIINTLGNKISTANAVLSPMFTAVKNLPGEIKGGLNNIYLKFDNTTLGALNTVTNFVNANEKLVMNSLGNISNSISSLNGKLNSGLGSAFSMITSFGAKLGFVLEIVGITVAVIVVVGIILYVMSKKQGVSVPGEKSI